MPKGKRKTDAERELDLHGLTVQEMRTLLNHSLPEWKGREAIRLIHGRGDALRPALEKWCQEMGLPFQPDFYNPGSLRVFPSRRKIPEVPFTRTLRESGLTLTPEQEALLRDPGRIERMRKEEEERKKAEEQKRREEERTRQQQEQQNAALFEAEMQRLQAMTRAKTAGEEKPHAPRVVEKGQIKHQEGYWRAEVARVARTDTETLKEQKKKGLDRLAPPLPANAPEPPAFPQKPKPTPPPKRDTEADGALFAAEMERLMEDF